MADFCNECAERLGMPKPDIDVPKIVEGLKEGYSLAIGICEGCGMVAVAKLNGRAHYTTLTTGWKDYETNEYYVKDHESVGLTDKEGPENG